MEATSHSILTELPGDVLAGIIHQLSPRDWAACSAVCSTFRHLATHDPSSSRAWQRAYLLRWPAHLLLRESHELRGVSWQAMYGAKMRDLQSYSGKCDIDMLYGHAHGIRCCRLLPQYSMLATGSLDRTVKLFDLQGGLPITSSRPIHKGTVRSVAIDANAMVSASADSLIRVWLPSNPQGMGGKGGASQRPDFDLSCPPSMVLHGHRGPVVSLSLTDSCLYSGSWDYSVRIWSRGGLGRSDCSACDGLERRKSSGSSSIRKGGLGSGINSGMGHRWPCCSILTYDDWVSCVAARGPNLCVSAGADVLVHDIETAAPVRKLRYQEGHVLSVEASQSGRLLFTGCSDGGVRMHDLRTRSGGHLLWQHPAAVHDLSFEDPWLASVCADGSVAVINTEHDRNASSRTRANFGGLGGAAAGSVDSASTSSPLGLQKQGLSERRGGSGQPRQLASGPPTRQMQSSVGCGYSVSLGEQWCVCGGASNVVRVWDFHGAQLHEERAAAAKAARATSKQARQAAHQERQMRRMQERQERQQQLEAFEQEQERQQQQQQQQQQEQQALSARAQQQGQEAPLQQQQQR